MKTIPVTIPVNVLDVYLDSENPRHDPINDRMEIIKYLVQDEKVKNLAKSIVKNGINPIELPAVTMSKGKFIVLEGNRRFCALILLKDPELCPENERSFFKNLIIEYPENIPEMINCALFSSRDEAALWIQLRHNGEQDGAGLRPWNATQKARYFDSSNNIFALKVLDYAEYKGFLSKADRTNNLTTVSRLLRNPTLRSVMGFKTGVSEPEVKIGVPIDQFDNVLKRFINDLIHGNDKLTSRSKKEDWENYAEKLKLEGIAPKTHCEPYPLATSTKGDIDNKENKNSHKTIKNNRDPNNRKNIIPRDFKADISNKNLKKAFKELRELNCNQFPLASSFLCRVFLENVYVYTYEKLYGNRCPDKMKSHVVLGKVIDGIEENDKDLNQSEKKSLRALKKVHGQKDNPLSAKTLGGNVHLDYYPTEKDLKVEWDNISCIVSFMLNKIADNDSAGHN